jgi:hypothetical protein
VWPFVLGGVGLASVGAGALLTYWGRTDNAALAQCTPNCPASSVAHIKTLYVASDVAFGAGAAAIGLATVLFFTSPSRERAAPRAAYAVDVVPSRSGGVATLSGVF